VTADKLVLLHVLAVTPSCLSCIVQLLTLRLYWTVLILWGSMLKPLCT